MKGQKDEQGKACIGDRSGTVRRLRSGGTVLDGLPDEVCRWSPRRRGVVRAYRVSERSPEPKGPDERRLCEADFERRGNEGQPLRRLRRGVRGDDRRANGRRLRHSGRHYPADGWREAQSRRGRKGKGEGKGRPEPQAV